MSLDIDLMITQPVSVWDWNITHNLGKMASAVTLEEDLTLYDVLWRPDENGIVTASEILPYLEKGLEILNSSPEEYKQYNPENGWGTYDGLLRFVIEYRNACIINPEGVIRASR
jgi:hypothetical protein